MLAHNWQRRRGELDIVGLDRQTLVFFEVRQRQSQAFGGAAGSISLRKQAHWVRAAQLYLQAHPHHAHRHCRFDALLIHGSEQGGTIQWLQHAFET